MRRSKQVVKMKIKDIAVLLVLTFVVFGVSLSPRGQHLTHSFYDTLRTTKDRSEVVVLGIDDKSLHELGAWPWERGVFASLVDTLNKSSVKAVAFDVLFLEKREGDEELVMSLKNTTIPIILGAKETPNGLEKSYLDTLNNPLVTSAIVNVDPDEDGKVRRYPRTKDAQLSCGETLAGELFTKALTKKSPCHNKETLFRYPGTITTYSISDVLSGEVPKEMLENKVIFVGATAIDLQDVFVSLRGEKIPGVTVHASIYTSLLNNIADKSVPDVFSFLVILFAACAGNIFVRYGRRVAHQVVAITLGCLVFGVLSVVAFDYGYELPFPFMVIAILATSGVSILNAILLEKRKNEKISSLFSKYVNKDVLEKLLEHPERKFLRGEKKVLTLLFSDLRGFTTLSEKLSPEDLTSLLNEYFGAMSSVLLKNNGTIDKFIGDAIMAFWNAPLSNPVHEEEAVRSALEMQERLKQFNKEKETSLEMGIGLHTGEAVVGNIGSEEKLAYTALGDTVNLTSRLESLTKKYGAEIIISGDLYSKVSNIPDFAFRKLDEVKVKGKNNSTVLYLVLSEKREVDDLYEKAFLKYQQGSFQEAEVLFEKTASFGDVASQMMLDRISVVKNQKEWNGVYAFEDK